MKRNDKFKNNKTAEYENAVELKHLLGAFLLSRLKKVFDDLLNEYRVTLKKLLLETSIDTLEADEQILDIEVEKFRIRWSFWFRFLKYFFNIFF